MKRYLLWLLLFMLIIPFRQVESATLIVTGVSDIHATTADSFTNDPVACNVSPNLFVRDISATGVLTCAQVNFSDLAGTATDAQIPHLNTLSTNLVGGRCVRTNDSTSLLEVAAGDCGTGTAAFSGLTSGTNTTGAFVIGTGASLAVSDSGTIAATTAAAFDHNPSACSAGQFASDIAADGTLTCGTPAGGGDALTSGKLSQFAATTSAELAGVLSDEVGASGGFVRAGGNVATATALAANGANCSSGQAPLGVDASGAAESCFDVATQAELDTHTSDTAAHSATSANTASRIVARDSSGNFSAGTITAALTGNASTATQLASNPTDCSANQFANAIAASGNLTCAQPATSNLSDAANVPLLNATNTWTGRQDASGATSTAPIKAGTTPPGTCASGKDLFFDTDASAGAKLLACIATDTWEAQGGASGVGSSTSGNGVRYTGTTTVGGTTAYTADATDILTVKNKVTTLSSNTTLGAHNVVNCDTSSGSVTLTLPSASSTTVGKYKAIKTSASNTCSVARGGSDTINNSSNSASVTGLNDVIEIELSNNGSPGNWHAITSKAQFGEIRLNPKNADLPASNAAVIDVSEPRPRLRFDTSTSWCAYWTTTLPDDYAGSLNFDYWYSMFSATSGTLAFDVSVWVDTSGSANNAETESYATANNCDDGAVPGTTAGKMEKISCALSNDDGAVANDIITLKMCRDVANDNASGDAEVLALRLRYLRN